jgi:hypothetical protein
MTSAYATAFVFHATGMASLRAAGVKSKKQLLV